MGYLCIPFPERGGELGFGRLSWALENGDNNTMNANMRRENVVLLVRKVLTQFNIEFIPIFVKKTFHITNKISKKYTNNGMSYEKTVSKFKWLLFKKWIQIQ